MPANLVRLADAQLTRGFRLRRLAPHDGQDANCLEKPSPHLRQNVRSGFSIAGLASLGWGRDKKSKEGYEIQSTAHCEVYPVRGDLEKSRGQKNQTHHFAVHLNWHAKEPPRSGMIHPADPLLAVPTPRVLSCGRGPWPLQSPFWFWRFRSSALLPQNTHRFFPCVRVAMLVAHIRWLKMNSSKIGNPKPLSDQSTQRFRAVKGRAWPPGAPCDGHFRG